MQPTQEGLSFGGSAVYRIVVQGTLHESYTDYLGGMSLSQPVPGQSMLVGQLRDQSALCGIICTLLELHMPLVSIEFLAPGERETHSVGEVTSEVPGLL